MPGKRRQGGQKKQWLDDLREWTGLTLPNLVSLAHDWGTDRMGVRSCCRPRPITGTTNFTSYLRNVFPTRLWPLQAIQTPHPAAAVAGGPKHGTVDIPQCRELR